MMQLDRTVIRKGRMTTFQDDGFVQMSMKRRAEVTPNDFAEEDVIFQIGVVPCRIDIITKIFGGISFPEARSQAEVIQLDDVQMPILSRDHLLTNKLATGRSKDIEDVKLLQQHRREP